MGFNETVKLYTLEETIDDQSDLYKLCRDRSLDTKELFNPNAFYGIDFVIKLYASISAEKILKIVIPHGVSFSSTFVWEAEQKSTLPCIYSYPPHRDEIYRYNTNAVVLSSASPFVYVNELLRKEPAPDRQGTIFFPAHSTHHVTAKSNFEEVAAGLERLDDKYKPISVCIYWRDFNLKHHKIFEEKGFSVVSAGHIFDQFFLFRLYHLCKIHKYSMSNELGSHLFYSVKAGCSFSLMNYSQTRREAPLNILQRDVSTPDEEIVTNIVKMFSIPTEETTKEQLQTVDDYLGTKNLKTPSELRQELKFADRLYNFGFSRHPETNQLYYRTPNLIPRELLIKIRRNIKKAYRAFKETKWLS